MTPEEMLQEVRDMRQVMAEVRQLVPTVNRIALKVDEIDDRVRQMQIDEAAKHARQDQTLGEHKREIGEAFGAIRGARAELAGHGRAHWRWMAGAITTMLAIATIIISVASWMSAIKGKAGPASATAPAAVAGKIK